MSKIAPLQIAFYKGMGGKNGALQFSLQKPHYFCTQKGCRAKVYNQPLPPEKCPIPGCPGGKLKSREGAVFMDITSTKGPNDYDWDNKIVMALTAEDLSTILLVLENQEKEVKIVHDPGAKTASQGKVQKFLNISSPKGINIGCIFSATMKSAGKDDTKHMVPLSGSEVKRLAVAIRAAISLSYAWD